ncbi:hypothetical protein TYRP_008491 [Tyrophagus putrescentiae]|nr:hypothetical protein TYRP_008491 [Tyrophagus putrescentiae]
MKGKLSHRDPSVRSDPELFHDLLELVHMDLAWASIIPVEPGLRTRYLVGFCTDQLHRPHCSDAEDRTPGHAGIPFKLYSTRRLEVDMLNTTVQAAQAVNTSQY